MTHLFGHKFFIIFTLCVLDFIFGFAKAWNTKSIQSHKMKLGGVKVAGELAIIVFSNWTEQYIGSGISLSVFIFYFITEYISLIENMKELGIPIPPILSDRLKERSNDDSKEE